MRDHVLVDPVGTKDLVAVPGQELHDRQGSVRQALVTAVVVSALLAFFIVGSTNKALRASVQQLTEGAEQVVSASGQVATSAQSLSQGATEQAASLSASVPSARSVITASLGVAR